MRVYWLICLVVATASLPAGASKPGALVAKSIQVYEQVEAIRAQMREAVGDLADEKRAYELAMYELKGEPMTDEQLSELAADIRRQAQALHRYRKEGGTEASIAYAKKRIRDLSLMHRAGKLKTQPQRAAFRAKFQPKIDELNGKINTVEAPYRAKIQALQTAADAGNDELTALIRPYLKTPDSAFPGANIDHVNATVHMAFGASHWKDRDDKQIAWAHVRIRSLDEVEDYHREQLLDDTYPIQSLSDGSLWVWAGHFLITFVADDEAITGEDNIQHAIHQFIDLEGLAEISAETELVVAREVGE